MGVTSRGRLVDPFSATILGNEEDNCSFSKKRYQLDSFTFTPQSPPSFMIHRSPWRVAALLAFVGACIVAAVTIALVIHGGGANRSGGDASLLGQTLAVDADPLVVTDVRVVEADTDDAARNNCSAFATSASAEPAEWIIAGKNLNTAASASPENASFVYLCMRQAHVSEVVKKNDSMVLQSLRVITTMDCPSTLQLIYRPRPSVVICSQTIAAAVSIATGMYVSDLTVTTVHSYSAAVSGWITADTSIELGPMASTTPIYLSYKRPVRPIISTEVLHNVQTNDTASACAKQLGARWEQAGDSSISSAAASNSTQTVLCIERAPLNSTDSTYLTHALPRMLVEVEVEPTPANGKDDCGDRQNLTNGRTLCFKYANSSTTVSFIGELRLQEFGSNAVLPGSSKSKDNANDARIQAIGTTERNTTLVVLYRQHTGILVTEARVESVASASVSATEGSSNSRAPLLARQVFPPTRQRKLRGEGNKTTNQDLSFKIVQLADLHLTGDASHECRNPPQEMIDAGKICTEADTTAFVEKVLDAETPDFVVFSGDNVEVLKGKSLSKAIEAMLGPVEARKIPYAVVFGNHDDENGQSRGKIAQRIIGRQYSYMQWGPQSVAGVGNYELSVMAPSDGPWGIAGSKVFQMYFLDSHGYPDGTLYPDFKSTYDWIKPEQVAYYKEMALANRKAYNASSNASSALPAVMFFHIPLLEYASVGSATHRSGDKNEYPGSSEIQSNLFSALVEMGDVKATFVGHDHLNEFCYKRQDIQLCYGGSMGFAQAYGSAQFARRSRVIEWSMDSNSTRQIKSWKRHYGSAFATRQHEEILYKGV